MQLTLNQEEIVSTDFIKAINAVNEQREGNKLNSKPDEGGRDFFFGKGLTNFSKEFSFLKRVKGVAQR
ncbi:hypothetical protein [Bacillus sp. AR18-7]|uniref:hypothetical protein n=1 Tax=Bacillus sp. AR18-7 TaxID=2217821 RepID=UPI0011CCC8EB|nr:hypothetical protein [Bacillus sp. AR18-7]TXR68254.1 hypothetical protein DN395_00480 [Bacillus sp. AR18-7]